MISLGPLTVYERNCAMYGCLELRCFGGWLCVFPPVFACGQWRTLRAYWSPNGTPWHHGMRPLIRARRSRECPCGAPDCSQPQAVFEEEQHAEARSLNEKGAP
jgi:hypothetical protein